MNAKASLCMNRIIIVSAVATLLSLPMSAQTYQKVVGRNFWNDGINVAGIRQDSLSRSVAEIFGGHESGGFKASFEASNSWHVGARAATITHLKKFSMTGSFGFRQFEGDGMKGSMFVKPGFYPFNIHEFTPGHKTIQTYNIAGGVSVDIAPNWRIGGRADFEATNYSKRKDLRHTNYRMELDVVPCVQYHNGPLSLGLTYIYSRNTESVVAEQIGSSVESYEAFFDKGLFYGVRQVWTGSGIHLKDEGVNGFPVKENMHGASAQFSYKNAYADIRWRSRLGVAGEKDCIWYRFPGWDLNTNLGYRFTSKHGTNIFRGKLNYLKQDNYETVLDKVTSGGVTTTAQYGSNLIYSRSILNASIIYRLVMKLWEFGGDVAVIDTYGQTMTMYPYVAYERLTIPAVTVSALRHLWRFDLGLAVMWSNGLMSDTLSQVSSDSGVQGSPERLDAFFVRFREQMTSDKIVLTPSVRYNFNKPFFIQGSFRWLRGFNLEYLGDNRFNSALTFGYNF